MPMAEARIESRRGILCSVRAAPIVEIGEWVEK